MGRQGGEARNGGDGDGSGKERGMGVDPVAPNIITQYDYIGKISFDL